MFERRGVARVVAEQSSQRHQRHVPEFEQARLGAVEHESGSVTKHIIRLVVDVARDEFARRVERGVYSDHREQGILARAVR